MVSCIQNLLVLRAVFIITGLEQNPGKTYVGMKYGIGVNIQKKAEKISIK